jgi:hypothetical protein
MGSRLEVESWGWRRGGVAITPHLAAPITGAYLPSQLERVAYEQTYQNTIPQAGGSGPLGTRWSILDGSTQPRLAYGQYVRFILVSLEAMWKIRGCYSRARS